MEKDERIRDQMCRGYRVQIYNVWDDPDDLYTLTANIDGDDSLSEEERSDLVDLVNGRIDSLIDSKLDGGQYY